MIPSEALIRLAIFVAGFAMLASLEVAKPEAGLRIRRLVRWPRNLAMLLINTVVVRVAFPAGAVAAAILADQRGWGLLNRVELNPALEMIFAIVALDLVVYGQHMLFHLVPVLFRFHRVHHADLDFDITLATRFHPIEMLASMVIKYAAVLLLGASAVTVLVFESVLNLTSMFNHANMRLPEKLDRLLRLIVVTPAMHRVHHSFHPSETNSNFGFNLPWWDRLFGTYRRQSVDSPIEIGLPGLLEETNQSLAWMLRFPFRSRGSEN
ncbi:MAG: sterol desaturase family protein [Thermoanaerobaculia bacterium]|nr:sterol desaturase family protein [Thermoanaerobaculia bacterium]